MSLILAIVIAALFLDWPWNAIVVAAAGLWEAFEIAIFLRWRKRPSTFGPEALIGARGVAVTACKPEGQARIVGRFWSVACDEGAEPGDPVVVTAVEGTKLRVDLGSEPVPRY
jgi:membrane protein implicated in regulation of membrane protease activity